MLRQSDTTRPLSEPPPDPDAGLPTQEVAYSTEEQPVGIRFYRARDSFYFPYHAVQWVSFTDSRITLRFPENDVIVEGQALHRLYVHLARQKVGWVVQQAACRGEGTFVSRIERVPRSAFRKEEKGGREQP